MAKELILNITDELYKKLEKQFEELEIDFNDGLKFVIESFVDDNVNLKPKKIEKQNFYYKERMTKSIAKDYFIKFNCVIHENYTYASRGREGSSSANIYWANPKFEYVYVDWTIILNDNRESILYLLDIPKNSFSEKDFVSRSDRNLIDMKIRCNDNQYMDLASQNSLKKYLIASIDYGDLQNLIFKKIKYER